jgi:hypothetical protein
MRTRTIGTLWLTILTLLPLAAGCGENEGELRIAQRDFAQFEREVYPVLMKRCSFHTCHGDQRRFFRMFGSARARLRPETKALAEVLPEEIMETYVRAIGMIDERDPGASLLLRKPLALAAGGAGHVGTDNFDRNVFQTAQDPEFMILSRWVFGAPPSP